LASITTPKYWKPRSIPEKINEYFLLFSVFIITLIHSASEDSVESPNKKPRSFFRNGVLPASPYFPPARIYGMEHIQRPFIFGGLLSPFVFEVYYIKIICRSTAFRKLSLLPLPLNNHLQNITTFDTKCASEIEEKRNSPIISATYKQMPSTLLKIDAFRLYCWNAVTYFLSNLSRMATSLESPVVQQVGLTKLSIFIGRLTIQAASNLLA
jgi:hypothetical protein